MLRNCPKQKKTIFSFWQKVIQASLFYSPVFHKNVCDGSIGYRRSFDKEIAKKSIDIIPALEIGRTDIITRLLEEDVNGISYLPSFTTEQKVKEGKLIYLDVCDMETDIWKQLIYHKNKCLYNSMKAFLEYVKEYEFNRSK